MFGNRAATTPGGAGAGNTNVPGTPGSSASANGTHPQQGGAGNNTTAASPTPPILPAVNNDLITIVVKNVYRNTSVQLHVPVTAALGSLKEAIREHFEERPAPDQQRLIYLGKVCTNDSIPLRDILLQSRVSVYVEICS